MKNVAVTLIIFHPRQGAKMNKYFESVAFRYKSNKINWL